VAAEAGAAEAGAAEAVGAGTEAVAARHGLRPRASPSARGLRYQKARCLATASKPNPASLAQNPRNVRAGTR
jgi:hypothetical protein